MTLVNTETGEIVEVTYADVKRSVEQAHGVDLAAKASAS